MNRRLLPSAFTALAALAIAPAASATLATYDSQIAAEHGGGGGTLTYEAILSSAETFDGTNVVSFDWGTISGPATFEFIIEGDPVASGRDGFIGAGSNSNNSLRYEQWDDTGSLGFTRAGVADYTFSVPSPTSPTHVTYRWDGAGTMDLFTDGTLADSITGATFDMPTGAGVIGNNAGATEGMVGTIHRITTYNEALSDSDIQRHADAWLVPEPSGMALLGLAGLALIVRRRR